MTTGNENETSVTVPSSYLLDFLLDAQDEEIVQAANETEQQLLSQQVATTNTTTIMYKYPGNQSAVTTFANCRIGNIQNLHVHIHKN